MLKCTHTHTEEEKKKKKKPSADALSSQGANFPTLSFWPTSSPCCSTDRTKQRLNQRGFFSACALQHHTSSHQSISHHKVPSGVCELSQQVILLSHDWKNSKIYISVFFFFFFLVRSNGKIITGRNYVAAEMEYSSRTFLRRIPKLTNH